MGMYAAQLTTAAGSSTLPPCALVGSTTAKLHIREIGVFNTTAIAVGLVLARLSTAGTPGASATTRILDGTDVQAASGILKNTYTSTAPTTAETGIAFFLGAAIGSGIVLTYGHGELVVPATTAAAIGFITEGTGQALKVYMKWQES